MNLTRTSRPNQQQPNIIYLGNFKFIYIAISELGERMDRFLHLLTPKHIIFKIKCSRNAIKISHTFIYIFNIKSIRGILFIWELGHSMNRFRLFLTLKLIEIKKTCLLNFVETSHTSEGGRSTFGIKQIENISTQFSDYSLTSLTHLPKYLA